MEQGIPIGDVAKLRKTAKLEDKLFCFEFKENSKSKSQFFKICDRVVNSYILLPSTATSGFLDMLNCCIGFDSQEQEPFNRQFTDHDKVFSFHIGCNNRGRFLKVSVTSMSNNKHAYIIIPSGDNRNKGWETFRSILMELNDTARVCFSPYEEVIAGHGVQTYSQSEPEPTLTPQQNGTSNFEIYKVTEACEKRFLFNIASKERGKFLKIREVSVASSPYIMVPISCLQRFYDEIPNFLPITKHSAELDCNQPQNPHTARNDNGKSEFSKVMEADGRRFLFELASNSRGPFLKIREVTYASNFFITIPLSSLEKFYDHIANFLHITNDSAKVDCN